MTTYRLPIALIGFLLAAGSATAPSATAGDDAAAPKSLDQQFEALLAAAQKDPARADWKALRRAFAETSHYEPYSITWRTELAKVGKDMRDGNTKVAEAALVKLLERERFMRLDGQAMAVALYEKMGQSDKATKHREFLDGLSSTVYVAGHGTSFEKPIEVLFIEEEYTVLASLGLKMKQQALSERDGHRFDVITTEAKGGEPERQFYFNIDLPWKALASSLGKAFERRKEPAKKK
jgi:hypothetical protein